MNTKFASASAGRFVGLKFRRNSTARRNRRAFQSEFMNSGAGRTLEARALTAPAFYYRSGDYGPTNSSAVAYRGDVEWGNYSSLAGGSTASINKQWAPDYDANRNVTSTFGEQSTADSEVTGPSASGTSEFEVGVVGKIQNTDSVSTNATATNPEIFGLYQVIGNTGGTYKFNIADTGGGAVSGYITFTGAASYTNTNGGHATFEKDAAFNVTYNNYITFQGTQAGVQVLEGGTVVQSATWSGSGGSFTMTPVKLPITTTLLTMTYNGNLTTGFNGTCTGSDTNGTGLNFSSYATVSAT